jgi:hypothetical protein
LDLLSETRFDVSHASAAETLKREVLLEELALNENAQLAGPATALLAVLYRDLDRWDLVARQSQRLRTDFADIDCSAGAKGADVAKQLDEQAPDRQSVAASASTWPHSQMTVVRSRLDLIGGSEFSVDWAVSPGSAMTNWQMRLSLQENTLFGMDELGRERFRCDLTPYLKMPQGFPYYYSQRAWSRGHLLIYATGAQVFAIDLLSAGREGEAEVLWTQELVHWPAKNMGMSFSTTTVDWGEYRVRMTGPKGISIGGMELIHPELLCGVRNGALLGLDPYTGERLWARDDVNTTASIFGNRERIYLVEQNSKAIVLDTATGVKLGERELANDREIVLAADGKFLVWNRGNNVTLSWQDPWEGTTLWKTELPNDSKAAVIDAQYLAVVQPDWHFRLLRIKDGAVLSSGRIAPNSIADGVGLQIVCGQKSDDGFVIAAGERVSTTNVDGIQRSAINDGIARVLLSGVVFGISANSTTAEQEAGQAPRWTTNINKMTFLRTQPVAVPLLTLACVAYDRKENTLQNRRTEFLILDTRNGQAVLDEAIEGSTNAIRTEAEASRDLIRIRTSVTSIQIRFAEETLPGATPPGAPLPGASSPDSPR